MAKDPKMRKVHNQKANNQWLNIVKGYAVDLAKVLGAHYSSDVDTKQSQDLGDLFQISIRVPKQSKAIKTYEDWFIAFGKTIQAIFQFLTVDSSCVDSSCLTGYEPCALVATNNSSIPSPFQPFLFAFRHSSPLPFFFPHLTPHHVLQIPAALPSHPASQWHELHHLE